MPPYDSDSSGDEDENEYTKTNVVLGFAASESAEGDTISHLGGVPVWFELSHHFLLFLYISNLTYRPNVG